jgi:hypothetical protein
MKDKPTLADIAMLMCNGGLSESLGAEHNQPKPTTGHQTQILEENSQVAKTLQEWTPALLSRLFDTECSPEEAIKRICSLHNAALAAEREKWIGHGGSIAGAAVEEIQQLREQLAAEIRNVTMFAKLNEELQTQLSAAKEALQMLRDFQNGCPLPSYEKGWNEAMAMADKVIRK